MSSDENEFLKDDDIVDNLDDDDDDSPSSKLLNEISEITLSSSELKNYKSSSHKKKLEHENFDKYSYSKDRRSPSPYNVDQAPAIKKTEYNSKKRDSQTSEMSNNINENNLSETSQENKIYKFSEKTSSDKTPYRVNSSEINTSDVNLISVNSINGKRVIN